MGVTCAHTAEGGVAEQRAAFSDIAKAAAATAIRHAAHCHMGHKNRCHSQAHQACKGLVRGNPVPVSGLETPECRMLLALEVCADRIACR